MYRTRYAPSLGGATPFRPFSERKTAARDLIRLSGLEEGTDIEIEFVGVRPGEKLYEEVFFGHEDVRSTHHPKVLRTISTEPDAGFADAFDALIR